MRILLIDDEEELVSTLAERLSYRGIDADWATSGKEALEKVTETSYDIAVVDIKMPKIGGIELKRMMAEKYPGMKFIFMTGHGSEEDFRTGSEEAGAEYYLVKPVDIEELTRKLKEVLEK
jgi:DNA-binding response OmpR family regulator